MKIYSGAVIIWVEGFGKIFNDIQKADKYFLKQAKLSKNPVWNRVFEPVKRFNGINFVKNKW